MGEPTYFDGPDYPDGTDAEGFPGGDQRFGLIKPTKEEVEEIRELIVPFAGSGRLSTRFELIIRLCDAYLALREEVKEADRKAGEARRHWEYMRDRQHAHDDWLRKAKEQWGVHENTSFDVVWNECLQLKADNEALREDYKEANVLLNGYDKLLTKLRDQRDKDQEEIRKFHADNEALREKLAQVEQASQRIIGNIIGEQTHGTY